MTKYLASTPGQIMHFLLAMLLFGGGTAVLLGRGPEGSMVLIGATLVAIVLGIIGIGLSISEFGTYAIITLIAGPFVLFLHHLGCWVAMKQAPWSGALLIALGVVVLGLDVIIAHTRRAKNSAPALSAEPMRHDA